MDSDFDWLGMLGVLVIMALLFVVPAFVLHRDRKQARKREDLANKPEA